MPDTGKDPASRWAAERKRRQGQRNWAVLVLLLLLSALFFAISAVRFGEKLDRTGSSSPDRRPAFSVPRG